MPQTAAGAEPVEGLAIETLQSADLLMPDTLTAFALLDNLMRIVASLRK